MPHLWALPKLTPLTSSIPSGASPGTPGRDDDPFRLLRLVVGALLFFATALALALALFTHDPRALLLVGAFWAVYGLILGIIDGILEPVIGFAVTALQNVGLRRIAGGYSAIEALVVQGQYDAAANEYLVRARAGNGDVEAMVRRALLLGGPLRCPEAAVVELENFRNTARIRTTDDIRIGLALAELYELKLGDTGKAMGELRRLIDLHPASASLRRARRSLAALREQQFGEPPFDVKPEP